MATTVVSTVLCVTGLLLLLESTHCRAIPNSDHAVASAPSLTEVISSRASDLEIVRGLLCSLSSLVGTFPAPDLPLRYSIVNALIGGAACGSPLSVPLNCFPQAGAYFQCPELRRHPGVNAWMQHPSASNGQKGDAFDGDGAIKTCAYLAYHSGPYNDDDASIRSWTGWDHRMSWSQMGCFGIEVGTPPSPFTVGPTSTRQVTISRTTTRATTRATPVAQHNCRVGNQGGHCMSYWLCPAGKIVFKNYCPGAVQIMCCVPEYTSFGYCSDGSRGGVCVDYNYCSRTERYSKSGLCAGPDNVRCCFSYQHGGPQ